MTSVTESRAPHQDTYPSVGFPVVIQGCHFNINKTGRIRSPKSRHTTIKPKHTKMTTLKALKRMSHSVDVEDQHTNETEEFLDMLSKAQGNRYENQRSPYPSPVLTRIEKPVVNTENTDDKYSVSGTSSEAVDVPDGGPSESHSSFSLVCSSPSKGSTGSNMVPPMCPASPSHRSNKRSVELLKKTLQEPAPYPLIVDTPDGGYKVFNGEYSSSCGKDGTWHAPEISTEHFRVDADTIAPMYGKHFAGKAHSTYVSYCEELGPLVLSLMVEEGTGTHPQNKMLLRTQDTTIYKTSQASLRPEEYLNNIGRHLNGDQDITLGVVNQVSHDKVHQLIQKFDEHSIAKKHKFGVIYQKFGQTTEEEMFSNKEHTAALEEFLELVGDKVSLQGFEGYRGGLDTIRNQTGEHSVYTKFQDQEIMFHVSTLLPHDHTDPQQVCKKRHIGNDIVAIVFQDENTPFSPNCVRSHFLHAYIVVQVEHANTDHTVYKVAVAAKDDVPEFDPPLPDPAVFSKDCDFREWLLTKLLNAEFKCHQAPEFRRLATRTRSQLFVHLIEELTHISDDTDLANTPTHRRKSTLSSTPESSYGAGPRRRTFGALFSPRKKNTGSPKLLSRRILSPEEPNNRASLTTSTPDLTALGDKFPYDHAHQTTANGHVIHRQMSVVDSKEERPKKRFTIGKKVKKAKRRSHTTDISKELGMTQKQSTTLPQGPLVNRQSYSSQNWSVPDDLPGVVSASSPSSQTPSLDNMFFPLESSLGRGTFSSNPDFAMDDGSDFIPSMARRRYHVQCCDVATQVGAEEEVQHYYSPSSQSAVPGIRYISPSSGSSLSNSRHTTPLRPLIEGERDWYPDGTQHRQKHGRTQAHVLMENSSEDEEDDSDNTYGSLMTSLESLTSVVASLRQEQLKLYKQNTKLSNQNKKWQERYHRAQDKLLQQQEVIEQLRTQVPQATGTNL